MDSGSVAQTWVETLGPRVRVFIVPEVKVVYVSVAKNACTTLKRVMADLAREDLEKFQSILRPHAVHDRKLFKNALMPSQVDKKLAAEISADNGWFIFGLVRDPRARLFSAWQDKFLLQDPTYRHWRNAPWYPSIPTSAESIVADFARFVDLAAGDFKQRRDTHFQTQVRALFLDKVPFSHMYRVEKLGDLHTDLTAHVQAQGWTEPVVFHRSHDTPLRANAAVFAGPVKDQIEELYAPDFAQFGSMFDFDRIEKTADWTDAELHEVQLRAISGRKMSAERDLALRHKRRAEAATRRVRELEHALTELRRTPPPAPTPLESARRLLGKARRKLITR